MKRLIFTLIVCALMATPAMANPSFGDGGAALQGVLDGIAVDGTSDVKAATDALSDMTDSYWSIDGSGGSLSTMIIELAGFAGSNTFGVYSGVQYVQLFAGTNISGDQVALSIELDGSVHVNFSDTGVDFAGDVFGYYLNSPQGLFHSDTNLNADSWDHMAAYQGIGEEVQIAQWAAGPWTNNMYVLAFEDLIMPGADNDFTDMVLMVESVNPIPAPGAIILGSIGVGLVGWLRRRKSL